MRRVRKSKGKQSMPHARERGRCSFARAAFWLTHAGLITALAQQLEAFEPLLATARAEQHERIYERLLREEQEAECT